MRGSPPIHLFILGVAFLLFALPLARLTFARQYAKPVPQVVAPVAPANTTHTFIRVRFAHIPVSLSIKNDGRECVPGDALAKAKSVIDLDSALIIPADGLELLVHAQWSPGTPDTAITLELEPDGLDNQTQTRWSSGATLTEILSFRWTP